MVDRVCDIARFVNDYISIDEVEYVYLWSPLGPQSGCYREVACTHRLNCTLQTLL